MIKLLLLEDDQVLAESLIELLESENFDIVHVLNSQKALDETFLQKFDLLLLDVNVPLFNGFELLKSLRDSGDKTPAIFLTALTDIASLSKGFDVGADDYIKKPFDFDELLIRINAILKKQYHTYSNELTLDDFHFFIEKNELYKYPSFDEICLNDSETISIINHPSENKVSFDLLKSNSNKQIFVSLFLYNRKNRFLATNILGIVIFVD